MTNNASEPEGAAPLYDALVPGTAWAVVPSTFEVSAEVVAAFRDATGEADGPGVPPMLAAVYVLDHLRTRRTPPGGIHARQRFTFHAPIRIGDRLTTTAVLEDKYVRKGRRWIEIASETRDGSGAIVTTGRMSSIWGRE